MATTLHVIDGTATLFRTYFGMGKMQAPDGREVGGLLGYCQALSRFVRTNWPSHVALVFDSPEKTFRHDMYPEYKANRGAPPEDMEHQFDLSRQATEALGFASFAVSGYEADDLMATFAARAVQAGIETVLVTPDKDVMQLVGPGVTVMDPKTYDESGPVEVERKFEVPAKRLLDFLAIAGDSSDNIPGVRGIGPKGAAALVRALGGIDEIYERIDEVPELPVRGAKSMAGKLADQREQALLSRDLVRLREDVPLRDDSMTLGNLRYRGPRPDADGFFDAVGFHGPLRSLRSVEERDRGQS